MTQPSQDVLAGGSALPLRCDDGMSSMILQFTNMALGIYDSGTAWNTLLGIDASNNGNFFGERALQRFRWAQLWHSHQRSCLKTAAGVHCEPSSVLCCCACCRRLGFAPQVRAAVLGGIS
jgi:hypothetical protein